MFRCTPTHLTILSVVMLFVLVHLFSNHYFAVSISKTPSTHLLAGDSLSLEITYKFNFSRPYSNKEYVRNRKYKFSFCFKTLSEIIINLQIILRNIQRAQSLSKFDIFVLSCVLNLPGYSSSCTDQSNLHQFFIPRADVYSVFFLHESQAELAIRPKISVGAIIVQHSHPVQQADRTGRHFVGTNPGRRVWLKEATQTWSCMSWHKFLLCVVTDVEPL